MPYKRKLNYFYSNGDLHKVIFIDRPKDFVRTWNYAKRKSVGYVYSDLLKNHKKAWSTAQVGKMIDRKREVLEWYILDKNIRVPQRTYSLDGRYAPGKYMWSEEDILALHEYLTTVHTGRPRKDGQAINRKLPTRAELRAMMRSETVMYVKNSAGEFVPIWKEPEW